MKSDSDEPPSRHSAGVDTNEFFLPGAGVSALLIHGLTGTPYEMRYLGEQLAARGVRVRGVKLAGHAGTPEALGAAGYDNWYESVVNGLEELRQYARADRGGRTVDGRCAGGAAVGRSERVDRRSDAAGAVVFSADFDDPRAAEPARRAGLAGRHDLPAPNGRFGYPRRRRQVGASHLPPDAACRRR